MSGENGFLSLKQFKNTKFGFIDETQAWHCRAFLVWQDYCRYIQETTILTDEEQTDAFH